LRKKLLLISLIPVSIVVALIVGLVIVPLLLPLNQDLNFDVTILKTGNLVLLDDSHWGNGTVQLVEKADGSRAIYFIDVEIASGPDLYIYISNKSDFIGPTDTPGEFSNLGKLRAFRGTFEAHVSSSLNLGLINSVLIWCLSFTVVFTYASLT
jgi:hypothetical protein